MADTMRVVVSVRAPSDSKTRDLEMPATTPLGDLACHIAVALGWVDRADLPASLNVFAEEGGAALPAEKSLQDLDMWDGATLIIGWPPASKLEMAEGAEAMLRSTSGQLYRLLHARYRLGRRSTTTAAQADALPLLDLRDESEGATVSREHALLVCDRNEWILTARETSNGTSVNDEPLLPGADRVLCTGDRIMLGDVKLTFLVGQKK
ncbi:MAG: FHA domain-containing protein [Ardenticatenia bacterium]|nr:FHA domain-containing protein [Ardenticatenia bacterium]